MRRARFYEKSTDMLGMTPSQYRAGGTNEEIKFAVGQTSLGAILVASSKKGVASILLGDDPEELVRNLQDRVTFSLPSGEPSFARPLRLRRTSRESRLSRSISGAKS
jgi:hypothetical protein